MNIINFNMNIIKESLMPGPSSATDTDTDTNIGATLVIRLLSFITGTSTSTVATSQATVA